MLTISEVAKLNNSFKEMDPKEIILEVQSLLPKLTLAFSGAEDILLVHWASSFERQPPFFSLDTGRLHPETQRYIEQVRKCYKLDLNVLHPDQTELDVFIKNKGLFSFYEDGHEECCGIRKVAPLSRHLKHYDAWVTGQRKDQSPTRREVPVLEIDASFSTAEHQVIKVNPLADWSSSQVWDAIRMLEISYNPLHDQGFVSIGCEPCTKPIGPNQHEREGRWWWEEATIKECGLHRGNLDKT